MSKDLYFFLLDFQRYKNVIFYNVILWLQTKKSFFFVTTQKLFSCKSLQVQGLE